MKVAELIEALKALPQDYMVVRSGYEGGVTEVSSVYETQVRLHVNEEWYYGEHEEIDSDDRDKDFPEQRAPAIYIG